MHLKQEIVNEALNKLATKVKNETDSDSVQIPVTLLAPNYLFYTYQVVFEKTLSEDGTKPSWIPKEVIKLE